MDYRPYERPERPKYLLSFVVWSLIIIALILVIICLPMIIDLAMYLSEPLMKVMP